MDIKQQYTPAEQKEIIQAFSAALNNLVEQFYESIVKPLQRWLRSPQVKAFLNALRRAARQVGIMPVRRKLVSTKRAMIYQRKITKEA
jgi:pantoate kinase